MSTAGVGFVAHYAFRTPWLDEWRWLPVVVGQEPLSLSWLWALHDEHRMFLPRLIYFGLGKLTNFDFRAGAYYNVLALSGLALAMMLVTWRLRGRTIAYDAFFPLVLLHWAQTENLLWGFQIGQVTTVVLAGAILLAIATCGPRLTVGRGLFVTTCLAGLGTCPLYGIAYLPALACWLAFAGLCRWREDSAHHRRDGALLMLLALVPVALVADMFFGIHYRLCESPSVSAALVTALQFLSGGLGRAAKETWPVSGVIAPAGMLYCSWQLYRVFRRQPAERVRAAGLFCFLGGVGSLTVAMAMGRPGSGFLTRYMTLGAPLLCLFYVQLTVYAPPAVKIRLQHALALLMWGLLIVNTQKGLCFARSYETPQAQFEQDVQNGLSTDELAVRYDKDVGFPLATDVFAQRLEMLRQSRLGPYRHASGEMSTARAAGTMLR
jgi:hypothetical protein